MASQQSEVHRDPKLYLKCRSRMFHLPIRVLNRVRVRD